MKLFMLLLGLAIVAAVIDATPCRKSTSKRQMYETKNLVKRSKDKDWQPDVDRDSFIQYIKHLTPERINEMGEGEKLALLTIFTYLEIEPRKATTHKQLTERDLIAKHLAKRESEEFTREEFIQYLLSQTEDDVEKMSEEEKIGLVFLYYLFDIQPEDLEELEKRASNGNIWATLGRA